MKIETVGVIGVSGGIILVWSILFSTILGWEFKNELKTATDLRTAGYEILRHVQGVVDEAQGKVATLEAWARTYGKVLQNSIEDVGKRQTEAVDTLRAILEQQDPEAAWRARMEARIAACEARAP